MLKAHGCWAWRLSPWSPHVTAGPWQALCWELGVGYPYAALSIGTVSATHDVTGLV